MTILNTTQLYTIDKHISKEQSKHPYATGEFTSLLHSLTFAVRLIAREVRRAGLNNILGLTEDINVHGETVRKIDIYANEAIIRSMTASGHTAALISEEEENVIEVPESKRGKYILAFDPLDGSSNVDVNITIGSIFSIFKRDDSVLTEPVTEKEVLRKGLEQVAAGYVLYGGSTTFVYTTGNGVNVFTYDPTIGEFLLTSENIQMPEYANHYSTNEGYASYWPESVKKYMEYIKEIDPETNRPFTQRYVAAAVADIHRILYTGGIYLYGHDKKQVNGKVRLMYEANPLAMIVEQAGGKAITNKDRILEVEPESIHQRVPIFIGSKGNIEEFEKYLKLDKE